MKNQTNRIMRKKKIFECFLSIHKSIGNVLISNAKKDKINHKYELLRKKVISNNEKYSLKEKSNLRETTLNNIYKTNNLCISKNNEENQINYLSRIKSKFAEKYHELYNITTNSNNKIKNIEKNNSVSYLSNKLRSMNNLYNYNEKVKTYIYNNKDYNLKRTFNNLNNDIFSFDIHRNCDNRYLSQTNLTNKINNRNYNNNIRKKLLNSKINGIKSVLKSMDKIKLETNKNILLNNYINNPNIINNNTKKKNNKNYFNISKSIKTNGCQPSYDKISSYNDLKSNLFTKNNLSLFGNDEKERIIRKINHFKVRLNLISMK